MATVVSSSARDLGAARSGGGGSRRRLGGAAAGGCGADREPDDGGGGDNGERTGSTHCHGRQVFHLGTTGTCRTSSADVGQQQVVVRLTANDQPSFAVVDEHDGGARHLVVVRTHRVPIGAGHRDGEDVADADVGRDVRLEDEDVAGLAVLADDPRPAAALGERARGNIAS